MEFQQNKIQKDDRDILYFLNLEVISISKSREGGICVYIKVGEKMRARLRHNIFFQVAYNLQSNRSEQLGAQIFFKLNGKGRNPSPQKNRREINEKKT